MDQNKTMYYKPSKPQSGSATLFIIDSMRRPYMINFKGDRTFGRDYPGSDRTIRVNSEIVGKRHGEFIYDDSDGSYYYIDNNSLNGTYINGERLQSYNERGSRAYRLSDGDIIRIDRPNLRDPHPQAVLMIFSMTLTGKELWQEFMLDPAAGTVTVGRASGCSLKLNDLMSSRIHAVLRFIDGGWYIADNASTNGVGVNGEEINGMVRLYPNDVIKIANTILVFSGCSLLFNYQNESRSALVINIFDKTVDGGKVLLKDIRADLTNGDFVLILGGSGAGKTTLIRAILGDGKGRANGRIILNGQDLYKNFNSLKSQIGMVPQFLTLRTSDTVRRTLLDTAEVKLGGTYSKKERIERVESVIDTVGIREHADKYISQLSGGQQKKVSVANQLIGFQKVFICDEPDSGLDAASRMQQMDILKDISKEGKIVMVISHEPDDAVEYINGVRTLLFTKVLVLARSSQDRAGHLAFFGDTQSALEFFGVTRLQDIMLEINPPEEGGKGLADHYIAKFGMKRMGN